MKLVAEEAAFGQGVVGYLSPLFIKPLVEPSMDLEAFGGSGVADQFHDHFDGFEWLTLPVASDMAEQSMFDLVPFACAGRKVGDLDDQSGFVGEALEFDFPEAVAGAVAATAVGGDEQPLRFRIPSLPKL